MLEPLELPVFPSCYNCISWSEDGEIAIATGEYVQILTPKSPSEQQANGITAQPSNYDWHKTRFRANVFTSNEWPIIFPQGRDQFSLGAEQSTSMVVGLDWSPPGLAKYRRSVLAVLTSNMILSLYEPVGAQGKWVRTTILNKALECHFSDSIDSPSSRLRMSNIRSFTWAPPLKIPASEWPYSIPESRWGVCLLAVANDNDDVIFLHVQAHADRPTPAPLFQVEVLTVTSLHEPRVYNEIVHSHSVFLSMLQSQPRILSLASGPWIYHSRSDDSTTENTYLATVNVAAINGPKLSVVKVNITVRLQQHGTELTSSYQLLSDSGENHSLYIENMSDHHFTGPVQWAHKAGSGEVSIAAGVVGGLVSVALSESTYKGQAPKDGELYLRHYPFFESDLTGGQESHARHCERISGMTVAPDAESDAPILHVGTVGCYTLAMPLSPINTQSPLSRPPWQTQLDGIRERFDIDHDLGGMAVSRVWGLASFRGLVAAVVTMHPADMVEYRTNAEDRLTILFSTANEQLGQYDDMLFHRVGLNHSADFLRDRRDTVLQYILQDGINLKPSLCPKVLYAAACSAIVQSQNMELLSHARKVLEMLGTAEGVDLTDEIAKCDVPGNSIQPKSAEELETSGKDIYEKCEVCDAGMTWYSQQETQCTLGHVFVRCSLTGLAIQEPGISKFCSLCKSEYIDEDLIGPSLGSDLQQTYKSLSNVFDTCIFCNGKFQP